MIRKVLAGICVFSLMYSCSKEEDGLPTVDPVVENNGIVTAFVPKVAKQDWAASDSTDNDRPETRAWDITWSKNEHIGFYMIKTSDNFALASALHKNKEYLVDNTYAVNPASSADLMYYPVNNNPVQFVAYCPYDATAVTNNHTVTYDFSDQSTQAKKEAVDFIFHKGSTEHRRSPNTSVALSFYHKFSKIRITLKQGTSGLSCAAATATLINMPATAEVDLKKLALNPNDLTAITPSSTTAPTIPVERLSGSTAAQAIFEAIVPYHTGTAYTGRKFQFNVEGKTYTYTLDPTFNFASGEEYKYELTLRQRTTTLDGLANCYIVAPGGGPVSIPITRAITIGGMPASAAAELEVLWDDGSPDPLISISSGFTGSDADRTFTVQALHASNQGNAVVAIKDIATGTIRWSWHLWVTNYDPNTEATVTPTGYKSMNRHLGATDDSNASEARYLASRGLYYQWGRKDPFPCSLVGTAGQNQLAKFFGMPDAGNTTVVHVTDPTPDASGIAAGILESIQHPTTFYCGIVNGDWLPATNDHLWNATTNTLAKTVYDPCPELWRIPICKGGINDLDPVNGPWPGLQTAGSYLLDPYKTRYMFGTWWHHAGVRVGTDGRYDYDGTGLAYWFAGVVDTGGCLIVVATWNGGGTQVAPFARNNKSDGYIVRCVSEHLDQ